MQKELYIAQDRKRAAIVAPIEELHPFISDWDRFAYKHDFLLVIGNGFDLNLGLKTTYRNFVESDIFKDMYSKRIEEKRSAGKQVPSLIDYLYGKQFCERWYDIESALLDYVSKRPDGSFVDNVIQDKEDYELICTTLIEYLSSLLQKGKNNQHVNMQNSEAGKLLKSFINNHRNVLYSFNYTPIDRIIDIIDSKICAMSIHKKLHGEITEETIDYPHIYNSSIILGIETDDVSNIAPGYSFLIKSNRPDYKSSNLSADLKSAREVVIFGHSICNMDFGYFKDYFQDLLFNTDRNRQLTIITKDESSRIKLLDNIRKMGVPVRDIFAHVTFEIILTDNIAEHDKDRIGFDNLLRRLEIGYH